MWVAVMPGSFYWLRRPATIHQSHGSVHRASRAFIFLFPLDRPVALLIFWPKQDHFPTPCPASPPRFPPPLSIFPHTATGPAGSTAMRSPASTVVPALFAPTSFKDQRQYWGPAAGWEDPDAVQKKMGQGVGRAWKRIDVDLVNEVIAREAWLLTS
jgi:hypothetical protein